MAKIINKKLRYKIETAQECASYFMQAMWKLKDELMPERFSDLDREWKFYEDFDRLIDEYIGSGLKDLVKHKNESVKNVNK